MNVGTIGHRSELTEEERIKDIEHVQNMLSGLSSSFLKRTIDLTGRDPREFIPKDLTVHHCYADYANKGYGKTNYVLHEHILSNIHYNITMRPGRSYYVDGICVHAGSDSLEDIQDYEANYVAPVNPKPSSMYH